MRSLFCKLVMSSVALLFVCSLAVCGEMSSAERVKIVKALKLKGIVGENNKGLLEFRGDEKTAEDVVEQENAARQKTYKEIAQKNGSSADAVGEARAKQIAKEEASGVWIQDPSGKWSKK